MTFGLPSSTKERCVCISTVLLVAGRPVGRTWRKLTGDFHLGAFVPLLFHPLDYILTLVLLFNVIRASLGIARVFGIARVAVALSCRDSGDSGGINC